MPYGWYQSQLYNLDLFDIPRLCGVVDAVWVCLTSGLGIPSATANTT